jgi:uncharacterized Zn finger protein
MCKHVAAVLYGIGARFDNHPELLFRLRGVDETDLIVSAGQAAPLAKRGPAARKRLADEDLSAIFGLDMAPGEAPEGKVKKARPKAAPVEVKSKKGKPAEAKKGKKLPAGERKPRRKTKE